jgi:hypothetical protein
VSPVKYEMGFICQKITFFIVTAVTRQILHRLESSCGGCKMLISATQELPDEGSTS